MIYDEYPTTKEKIKALVDFGICDNPTDAFWFLVDSGDISEEEEVICEGSDE